MEIALLIRRILGSALTLYMMAIVLRWVGPWLELDLKSRRLAWLVRITDPLILWLRKLLPNMGPMDWSPIAAVLLIWMIRIVMAGY